MRLVQELLDRLAEIGADPPGITREAFGAGENAAMALMAETARGLGLACSVDAGANLSMRWAGSDPSAAPVLIGSHLDSVVHGGNFDGAAGVVAGLAAIAGLQAEGFRPRASIEVLALRCEEAVWFGLGLIGSRSLLGRLPEGALDLPHARGGRSLRECIAACGGDPRALGRPLRDPRRIGAYVEVHIEQAPQLVEAGQPVALCLANPGNVRHPQIRITGEDAHTGLPHRFRHDAALAGAELALALERLWLDEEAARRPMAVTIGRFHTLAGRHAMTVVPGAFEMSLDLRAYEAAHLQSLEAKLHGLVGAVAARRGVAIDLGPRSAAAPGAMDAAVLDEMAAAAGRRGLAPPRLNSPGSHDANNFAAAGVPTGMLLIRNRNGSHNPHEAMETDDLLAGIGLLTSWLGQRAG